MIISETIAQTEARLRAEVELHAGRLETALRRLREFQLSLDPEPE